MKKKSLKVGQVKAEQLSSERMGVSAHGFLLGAKRCAEKRMNGDGSFEMLVMPMVSMSAFAVELYLKAILTKLNRKAGYLHDLLKLYLLLPAETQLELWIASGITKDEFEEHLQNSADSFEEFRYLFEFDAIRGYPDFLLQVADAAKKIFERMK